MIGVAYAANGVAGAGAGGGLAAFMPFILIIVIFYFLLIRPQQKQAKEHQAFLNGMQKGDEVVTRGGLHGKITGLTDKIITLEIADNIRVKVSRNLILSSKASASEDAAPAATGGG